MFRTSCHLLLFDTIICSSSVVKKSLNTSRGDPGMVCVGPTGKLLDFHIYQTTRNPYHHPYHRKKNEISGTRTDDVFVPEMTNFMQV